MGMCCQSCGMQMGDHDWMYGTNADGSKNADYCLHCFENGAFTQEYTLEERIEMCIPNMFGCHAGMDENYARNTMREFFQTLKRWQ